MRDNEDIAKLVEIVIDIEQAKEIVITSASNEWLVDKVIPYIFLLGSQIVIYTDYPGEVLKEQIDDRVKQIQSMRDNGDIAGYIIGTFDYVLTVIRGYLQDQNTS